jgi:HSP20 family protein
MDYIKIRFGDEINHLGATFQKTIEEMFRSARPMFTCSECAWKPPIDMYEAPENITIIVEIAGVDKQKLELEINSKAVKIFGKRNAGPGVENGTYRLAEIQYGNFERFVFLPSPIDTEKVSASYANGFLKIHLPKVEHKKTHRVPISDG